MTETEKAALLAVLDYMLTFGCDSHPAPARKLNELREAFGMPKIEYRR